MSLVGLVPIGTHADFGEQRDFLVSHAGHQAGDFHTQPLHL